MDDANALLHLDDEPLEDNAVSRRGGCEDAVADLIRPDSTFP